MGIMKTLASERAGRSAKPGSMATYRCKAAPSGQHTSRVLRVATMRGGFVAAFTEGCHRAHAVKQDRLD